MTREEANFEQHQSGRMEFVYPDAPDPLEVFRSAAAFFSDIVNNFRTERAALVRLAAAKYLLFRKEPATRIARRLGVSRRRFHRVVAELRRDCGIG